MFSFFSFCVYIFLSGGQKNEVLMQYAIMYRMYMYRMFVDSETWLTSPIFSLPPPLIEFLLSSTNSLKKTSLTSEKPLLVGSIRASRMELMYGWMLVWRTCSAFGNTRASDQQRYIQKNRGGKVCLAAGASKLKWFSKILQLCVN